VKILTDLPNSLQIIVEMIKIEDMISISSGKSWKVFDEKDTGD
jgi:hypothetical protein